MRHLLFKLGLTVVVGTLLYALVAALWFFVGCELFWMILQPNALTPNEYIHMRVMTGAWPVLLICIILCGGLIWIPAIYRVVRIKRGQCPACGYPIGTSEVCTECGGTLKLQEVKNRTGMGLPPAPQATPAQEP